MSLYLEQRHYSYSDSGTVVVPLLQKQDNYKSHYRPRFAGLSQNQGVGRTVHSASVSIGQSLPQRLQYPFCTSMLELACDYLEDAGWNRS